MNKTLKLFLVFCMISLCNTTTTIQAQNRDLTKSQTMDSEIEEFIHTFYKDTWKKDEAKDRYVYLSEYLSGLITSDYKSKIIYLSDGSPAFLDAPKLDFNPFLNAQDTPYDLKVELISILKREYATGEATSKATILVNIFCFGEDNPMKYYLITENGKWIVDNITYEKDGREFFNFQKYMQ